MSISQFTTNFTSRIFVVVTLIVVTTSSCLYKKAAESNSISKPSPTIAQTPVIDQRGAINDYAEVFKPDEEKQIELLIEQMRQTANIDVAVLTVDSTNDQSMFDYSLAVARAWRPGGESGRGMLLVLATKDRQWRLQVSEQLRKELPDDVAQKLAEPSVAFYKQGNYAAGVKEYFNAILNHLKNLPQK